MNRRAFLIGASSAAVCVAIPAALTVVSPIVVGVDLGQEPSRTSIVLLARKNGKSALIASWVQFQFEQKAGV